MPFVKELYPANWLTTIRPAALKAAGYKCVLCRVPDRVYGYREANGIFVECDAFMDNWARKENKKLFKIVLTVSHTNHDTTDNRLSNLKALCQRCHLMHDKELHKANRKIKVSQNLPPPYSSLVMP